MSLETAVGAQAPAAFPIQFVNIGDHAAFERRRCPIQR
jgi:hypothetical protein